MPRSTFDTVTAIGTTQQKIYTAPDLDAQASFQNVKTWANTVKTVTDRNLKKLAEPSFSPEGIPQVLVPDEVFRRGAEIHKDFIIGIFMGKTPSYGHIQNVLSHVWEEDIEWKST